MAAARQRGRSLLTPRPMAAVLADSSTNAEEAVAAELTGPAVTSGETFSAVATCVAVTNAAATKEAAEPAATTLILQEASLGSGGVTGVVVEAAREEDSPGGEDLCRVGEAGDMGEAGEVLPGADKLQTTPPTKRRKAIDPLSLTPCF